MISFRRNKGYHFYQKLISLFLSVMILNICILVPVSAPKTECRSCANEMAVDGSHTQFFIEVLANSVFSLEGISQKKSGSSSLLEELLENFRDWMHGTSFNWKIIYSISFLRKNNTDFLFRSIFSDSPTSPPPEYWV